MFHELFETNYKNFCLVNGLYFVNVVLSCIILRVVNFNACDTNCESCISVQEEESYGKIKCYICKAEICNLLVEQG